MKESKIRLAMLVSGGASTAAAVIESCRHGSLEGKIDPVVVIASNYKAGEKVKEIDFPPLVVPKKRDQLPENYGNKLLETLLPFNVDLVGQLGWLVLTSEAVISYFNQHLGIFNQHPGPLDPGREADFGGTGMYGKRVMAARIGYLLATGEDRWTEATTHFVMPGEYDKGNLISVKRKRINVEGGMALATGQEQKLLLPIEHSNVINTLLLFSDFGKMEGYRREAPLIPERNYGLLNEVKRLAISLFPDG